MMDTEAAIRNEIAKKLSNFLEAHDSLLNARRRVQEPGGCFQIPALLFGLAGLVIVVPLANTVIDMWGNGRFVYLALLLLTPILSGAIGYFCWLKFLHHRAHRRAIIFANAQRDLKQGGADDVNTLGLREDLPDRMNVLKELVVLLQNLWVDDALRPPT